MGVLSSALCISLYWVLRWLPPKWRADYLRPVVGTPFAAMVLGEPLTPTCSPANLILSGVARHRIRPFRIAERRTFKSPRRKAFTLAGRVEERAG
jgi:hypothetical protein